MASDLLNELTGSSINIYGSRERIRGELIENAKRYLHLEGIGENIYKTSLLAYIIDTLSILSANQLFYDTAIYREFFMVDAQMQESVYNLARWIGYQVPKAVPANVNLIFQVPLTFEDNNVTFTIPKNYVAKAGDIEFMVDMNTTTSKAATFNFKKDLFNKNPPASGQIINNTALTIVDGNGYMRPIYYNDGNNGSSPKTASFSLPFKQHKRIVNQFIVPSSVQQYQFYSKELTFNGMVSAIRVWVCEAGPTDKFTIDTSKSNNFDPNEGLDPNRSTKDGKLVPWTEWFESPHGIYTMSSDSRQFIFTGGDGKGEVFFGNGIVGKQLPANSVVTIELYVTRGTEAYVLPKTITAGDKLEYIHFRDSTNSRTSTTSHYINYKVYNVVAPTGATDILTLPEIKQNAIINLRTKGRLVSEGDYDDINVVAGNEFPSVEAYPILKRSDIKTNEILTFVRLLYSDEYSLPQIVPARNIKVTLTDDGTLFNDKGQYTITRATKFIVPPRGDGNDIIYASDSSTSSSDLDDSIHKEYETIFNMTMDRPRMVAYYDYIAKNLYGTPAVLYDNNVACFYNQYTYAPINGIDFDIDVSNEGSIHPLLINVHLNHIPNMTADEDYQTTVRVRMVTKWGDNAEYKTLNISDDPSVNADWYKEKIDTARFQINNYLEVPNGKQRFEFYVDVFGVKRDINGNMLDTEGNIISKEDQNSLRHYAWMPLKAYYADVVIRQNLNEVMLSEMTKIEKINDSGEPVTEYTIHNVPAILSEYVANIDQREGTLSAESTAASFELTVLQALINNLELSDKRMLTDFINVKFPDTYGMLNNLRYNPVDFVIESITDTPFKRELPSGFSDKKYIVNDEVIGYTDKPLSEYINYIAEWYDSSLASDAIIQIESFTANRGIGSVKVTYGGSGYSLESTHIKVSCPDGGSGAIIVPTKINKRNTIVEVNIINPGTNYSVGDQVVASTTDHIGHGFEAEVSRVGSNGEIEAVLITNKGNDYNPGTVTLSVDSQHGSNAQLTAGIGRDDLVEVQIKESGSGYVPGRTSITAFNGVWYLRKPSRGQYIRVMDETDIDGYPKVYAYDGNQWIDVETFTIPLKIKLKVELDPKTTASNASIMDEIKYQLMYHFNPLMGIQKTIDRSEVVTVVRSVEGVKYCELLEPAIDIRFEYNIKELTQEQLIDYTPQYIGFTDDNIEIIFGNDI